MAKASALIFILALSFAPSEVKAQDSVIVRQESIPVEQVLGGKYKPSKAERESARETKRHNKALEKEVRKFRKDSPFSFGQNRQKQPKQVKRLSPNSNNY